MPTLITALPNPPSRNSSPETFSEDADNYLGAFPNFRNEINTLATELEGYNTTSVSAASTATTQAGIATTQAGIATTQAGIATTQAGIAATQVGLATAQVGLATAQVALAEAEADAAQASSNSASIAAAAAAAQEISALAYKNLAQDWAEKSTAILPGQYSAKYWAQQAAAATLGVLVYRGSHDASTGVYPVVIGTGDYWVVSVQGTISGTIFAIGDSLLYNGATWDKIDSTDSVTQVAGKIGAVTLVKGDVGLGNVDNTSDANKPVSTAQQTALNLKANLASPTFTGTVGGITASMVGLGNVNNTSDANKPVSTATQTALNLKRNLTETVSVTNGTFTAAAGTVYVLTGQTTLTLPASPSAGNWVSIVNRSGLLTCTIARNSQNIMGLAEDMTLDQLNATVTLTYADATRGWVIS